MNRGSSLAIAAAFSALLAATGCVRGGATESPIAQGIPWSEAPLSGSELVDEAEALAAALAGEDTARAVAALDRCLDLFDAARFGDDGHARDALWLALGDPLGPARGPEATKDAQTRLLQAAWQIEDAAGEVDEDTARFLADVIALLSVDVGTPQAAEDLSIATSAYRTIAESGHPRVRDNAHWRLYDLVRGVLAAATEVGAQRRVDVAVHALYARDESIETHLNDGGPHARAPLPSADDLWALLAKHRRPLLDAVRWRPIVERRQAADEELHEALRALMPVPRDPSWTLAEVPLGTGRAESYAPAVWASAIGVIVDPGHPNAAPSSPHDDKLAERIAAAIAADGRATVLLVADPELPAPSLAAILAAVARARLVRVEWAVREPDGVLTVLPLEWVLADDTGPSARAFRDARIQLHLEGRGVRAAVEGQWLEGFAATTDEIGQLLDTLRHAYPRENALGLSVADNVQPQQLVELARTAIGGLEPRFSALGILQGSEGPDESAARASMRARLETRAALWSPDGPAPTIEQPYPLPGDDQRRVESLGRAFGACLPELATAVAAASVTITFTEGRSTAHETKIERRGKRPAKADQTAFETCIDEALDVFRLRSQRDSVKISVRVTPPTGS